jgi:flagellin-like hook-associated protein FlgL
LQDIGLKSQIEDLDFTEAAMRFSLLQQQLQAGLQSASQTTQLSLLDFLR